jgi:hypothetical protein
MVNLKVQNILPAGFPNQHRINNNDLYICAMKKYLPLIVFFVVMVFILKNVSSVNWNIGIYSLFILFLGYELFSNLRRLYKIRRSQVCDGLIISYAKQKPDNTDDENYNVEIKFTSPITAKEYLITTIIRGLQKNDLVDVVYDSSNPENSKVYAKFSMAGTIFIILPLLFFIYQLIKLLSPTWFVLTNHSP